MILSYNLLQFNVITKNRFPLLESFLEKEICIMITLIFLTPALNL